MSTNRRPLSALTLVAMLLALLASLSPLMTSGVAAACPGPEVAIGDKGRELAGILGRATKGIATTPDRFGRFQVYERGIIYWHPQHCAHAVYGDILGRYGQLRWEQREGLLGYPLIDEQSTPNGRGRYQHFERGSLYWTPRTKAQPLVGAIRDRYAAMGWETSFLGFPSTGEIPTSDGTGRVQYFEGGLLAWTPESGVVSARAQQLPGGGLRMQSVVGGGGTREVSISGSVDIVDDENWPFKDERRTVQVNVSGFANEVETPLLQLSECAGDEVRVTLDLNGMVLENGAVLVLGSAKLFEGTSCTTDDLEHDLPVRLLLPAGRANVRMLDLQNSGFGGGDTARFNLKLVNITR